MNIIILIISFIHILAFSQFSQSSCCFSTTFFLLFGSDLRSSPCILESTLHLRITFFPSITFLPSPDTSPDTSFLLSYFIVVSHNFLFCFSPYQRFFEPLAISLQHSLLFFCCPFHDNFSVSFFPNVFYSCLCCFHFLPNAIFLLHCPNHCSMIIPHQKSKAFSHNQQGHRISHHTQQWSLFYISCKVFHSNFLHGTF